MAKLQSTFGHSSNEIVKLKILGLELNPKFHLVKSHSIFHLFLLATNCNYKIYSVRSIREYQSNFTNSCYT